MRILTECECSDCDDPGRNLAGRIFAIAVGFVFAVLVAATFAMIATAADEPRTAAVVKADDPTASAANRAALDAAAGLSQLPNGKLYVDRTVAHAKRQGLTLAGYGSTVFSGSADPNAFTLCAFGHNDNFTYWDPPTKGIGWIWQPNGANSFYRGRSRRFVGAPPPADKVMTAGKNVFRGVQVFRATAGTFVVYCIPDGLRVGEAVMLADGSGINEMAPVEWAVIAAKGATYVSLDRAITRTLDPDNAVLVAAAVGWPQNLVYRGLTFDAATGGRTFLKAAFDVQFLDCTFPATALAGTHGNTLDLCNCGDIVFSRCRIPCGIRPNSSRFAVRGCQVGSIDAEEWCQRCTIEDTLVWPRQFDAKVGCSDWTIRRCTFAGNRVAFYDGYDVADSTIEGPGEFYVRGYRAKLTNVVSDRPLTVQTAYEGAPPNQGVGIKLVNVKAPGFYLPTGSTGIMQRCTGPISGDPRGWTITP